LKALPWNSVYGSDSFKEADYQFENWMWIIGIGVFLVIVIAIAFND